MSHSPANIFGGTFLIKKQEPRGGNVLDIASMIASGLQLPMQKTKTQ